MTLGSNRKSGWSIALSLVASFALLGSPGSAENLGGQLRLSLGQQVVMDVAVPLEQVSIGDPKVIDVKVITQGRQVLITALGRGTTDLITWDIQGKQTSTLIQVIVKDVRLIQSEVAGMLGRIEGVEVRQVGDRLVIDGEVFTLNDLDRIKKVAEVYPDDVTLLARMSPSVSRLIASEITRSLAKNGYPDVRAEGIGDKIFLEGTAGRKEDLKGINTLAQAYFSQCVNVVSLAGRGRGEDLVVIDVSFVELAKSLGEKIGVSWDDSARFDITSLDYTIGILRSASDKGKMDLSGLKGFGATVEVGQNSGYARTLAHPKLVCKSGEKASFLAGGEVPYAVSGIGGGTVEFREYGIRLKISPVLHQDGKISASVAAESSSLDYANAVQGYPALRTRKVDTYVTLSKGQVLALSGLVNQKDSKDMDRMPVISNFPILGELFKSRNFLNDDTELVIFLAAELLSPEIEANQQQIKTIQEKYEKGREKTEPKLFD